MKPQKLTVAGSITTLANMADDVLINTLMLKSIDPENHVLPFLQVHALELAAKCALLKLEQKQTSDLLSHKIRVIFQSIIKHRPNMRNLFPSGAAFSKYRSVWIQDIDKHQNIELPNPDVLNEYEIAFWIENITELKYGFSKRFELTSSIHIFSPDVNNKFRVLFASTRAIYASAELNTRVLERGSKIFGCDSRTYSDMKIHFGIK
jgi:hypothetical protein